MNDHYYTIDYNNTINNEYILPCYNCSVKTTHKVLLSVNTSDEEGIGCYKDYEIVQCQGCKNISFRKNFKNPLEVDFNAQGDIESIDHEEIFPIRILGRKKLNKFRVMPSKVSRIYEETYEALCNRLDTLTTIGIRTLIEAIAKEKGAPGKYLKDNIDFLNNSKILSNKNKDILNDIRLLGNVAAHEVDPPEYDKLIIAFDIIENLLTSVYIHPSSLKK